jgi:hypothetical protein
MTITLTCGDRVTLPTYTRYGDHGPEYYCPTHEWQVVNHEQDKIDMLSDLAKRT